MDLNSIVSGPSSFLSNIVSTLVSPFGGTGVSGGGFGGRRGDGDNTENIAPFLPPVSENTVAAPSTATPSNEGETSSYSDYSNEQYFDDYLKMLQRASDIGLFSTAQDAADQAQIDRQFQSLEAQKERDWYENLANTSYQRQVQDLEAAGLNPILGWANFGTGAATAHASVPRGSASPLRAEAPNLSDYLNSGANIVSSAGRLLSGVGGLLKGLL